MRKGYSRAAIAALACAVLSTSACAGGSTGSADKGGAGSGQSVSQASNASSSGSSTDSASSGSASSGSASSGSASSGSASSANTSDSGGDAASCTGSVGFMGPITGAAASIGAEQLNFATLAVDNFNAEHGSSYQLVQGDTQLDPGQSSTVAQQFISNDDIFGIVGPAGTPGVDAVGPVFAESHMAFISASATATNLTNGDYPTFFRTIPNDSVQGPTDADFMANTLHAKKVVIVEEKTSYGKGVAESVQAALDSAGVAVDVIRVSKDQPDYSAVVTSVADDTDVVFVTFQIAANSQVLATQLKQQGKDAIVFGSDGSFSEDFTTPGSYVSSFAPDINEIPEDAAIIKQYTDKYGAFGTTYGPPVYVAAQSLVEAAQRACESGGIDRASVLAQVKKTKIENSLLGSTLSFTDSGDVQGAKFYVFKLDDSGKPVFVQ